MLMNCSTPYQPKGALGGYSSNQLEDNTYRVIFKGNQHTKAETVFEYLERRCAEITIKKGYKYFIVIEDSSYIDNKIFSDETELDDLLDNIREDKYLLGSQPVIDNNPKQTLADQKTKIARTYHKSFIDTKSTNVVGIFKIMFVDEIVEQFRDYYHPAGEILKKFKNE
jgi:hypothetical protein